MTGPSIHVAHLYKSYTGKDALRDVSFEVKQGEICGLIGPNGAGKTTLLRILATILKPSKGSISLAGHTLPSQVRQIRQRIGYMPDNFACYEELRVDAFLELFAHLYSVNRNSIDSIVDDILTLVDLRPLRHAVIERLSLGVRQRLSLARTILHNPDVLILDEPVSGLDPRARVEMRELLQELGRMGKSIIISSHVLADLADLCDRFIILEEGRVTHTGTLSELKSKVMGPRCIEIGLPHGRDDAIRHLRAKSWTLDIEENGDDGFHLILAEPDLPIHHISKSLFDAGFSLSLFKEREVDLEEAFLRLTQGVVS